MSGAQPGVRGRRSGWRAAALVLGVSLAAGLAVGGVMVWIAFQENPQGEYFDPVTGAVHWSQTLTLFGTWLLTVTGPLALALGRLHDAHGAAGPAA